MYGGRKGSKLQMPVKCFAAAAAVVAAAGLVPQAGADVLFDNGPIVTNPTGGTGPIEGQPISNADGFPWGPGLIASTAGVGAFVPEGTSAADDFVVPAGGWDLDALTVYAYQNGQTTATVSRITVNLWTSTPGEGGAPVLASPLVLDAGEGVFVAHRQSPSGTDTVRPVFAYTVDLDGLPEAGRLDEGTYWIEFSFDSDAAPGSRAYTPLVSPREEAFNHNAHLYNVPFAGSPLMWFEGREGYQSEQEPGRAYALPFQLTGTAIPEPASLGLVAAGGLLMRRRRTVR